MARDKWSRWLLGGRFGGDQGQRPAFLEFLAPVRVLDNASLGAGDVVLDVGAGDGLIGFGALERVGPNGRVILSDISKDLLDVCRARSSEMDVAGRCDLLLASAHDLRAVKDASVDAVTTRSVLIYLARADKARALKEFQRVLKPAGRVSCFEPINRMFQPEQPHLLFGYDVAEVLDLANKVKSAFEEQWCARSPTLLDFHERDLVTWTQEAGFSDIHIALDIEITPTALYDSWTAFMEGSGNPLVPPRKEVIRSTLSSQEAARLEAHLRPLVEERRGVRQSGVAYLRAVK